MFPSLNHRYSQGNQGNFPRVLFSLMMYFKRPNVKLAEAMSMSIDCIER